MPGEIGVRLRGGGRKVSRVGVEIAAGRFEGLVAEDALQDVQRDAGVGHPGRPGVA